jgi:hypothetical protein
MVTRLNISFEKTGQGNEIIEVNENCFISFNPHVRGMGLGFEADNNSPETAIVQNGKFKILNGDFRNECLNILKAGKGEKELLDLYKKNKNKHSSWST